MKRGCPVISVDTKKKELIGNFKQNGSVWRPKGEPELVNVHDFIDKELGKATPYGVYDVNKNVGWVNVGIDHDTAEFAVESIRRWWKHLGRKLYTKAKHLFITADSGGSNGSATVCGGIAYRSFRMRAAYRYMSVIFRPERANGIRSNTGCLITFQ